MSDRYWEKMKRCSRIIGGMRRAKLLRMVVEAWQEEIAVSAGEWSMQHTTRCHHWRQLGDREREDMHWASHGSLLIDMATNESERPILPIVPVVVQWLVFRSTVLR